MNIEIADGWDRCDCCGAYEWWSIDVDGVRYAYNSDHLGPYTDMRESLRNLLVLSGNTVTFKENNND